MTRTELADETTETLVRRCLNGDQRAWNALVDRNARRVHYVALRHGLSQAEAEDVAQEVFLTLAQSLHRIDDPEKLSSWLVTTTRRMCWRAVQKRRREAPIEQADLSEDPASATARPMFATMPSVGELDEAWHRQDVLASAMASLNQRCRDLITLLFLDEGEPSYDEISARAGIPKGSIGPTRIRCLQQLRTFLGSLGIDAATAGAGSLPSDPSQTARSSHPGGGQS
jgi:RNA polymerase sigma factor (sigma-70 family)